MSLQRDKRLILSHLLGCTYEDVFLNNPNPESVEGFQALWGQRLAGTPVARLIGKQVFRGLTFNITSHVLEPRIETEMIVEYIHTLSLPAAPSFLDLGTGSGCLMVSALHEFTHATGVAVDVSPEALAIAKHNGCQNNVNERAVWLQSNWMQNVPDQTFDVIMSNPPYIGLDEPLADDVLLQDPHLALFAGRDGLNAYRTIFKNLRPYCHSQTVCLFEIGYRQEAAIRELLSNWHVMDVIKDENNHPRVVVFTA